MQPVRRPRARVGRGDRDVLLDHLRRHIPDDREGRGERGRIAIPSMRELTEVADAEGKAGDIEWNFEKFLVAPGGQSIVRFRPTDRARARRRSSRPSRPCCRAEPDAGSQAASRRSAESSRWPIATGRSRRDEVAHDSSERAPMALFRERRTRRPAREHLEHQGDADLEHRGVRGAD